MPSDSNGVYSLPPGYLAETGDVIQATQHNPPLEDLATGMTARLMRSGVAPMTGPLLLSDGTSSVPSLALASVPGAGFYRSGSSLAPVGVLGTMPIGAMLDFGGLTAPTGWLYCAGQSVLRADYLALYNVIGTNYGSVDSTHFTLPDCRSVVTVGKGDMVSGDRGILTGSSVMGAFLGSQTATIDATMLPAHAHALNFNSGTNSVGHTHTVAPGSPSTQNGTFTGPGGTGWGGLVGTATTGTDSATHTHLVNGSTDNGPGLAAGHANVQPTLVVVKIIYAGV
jgi:microcystin-dependent protein